MRISKGAAARAAKQSEKSPARREQRADVMKSLQRQAARIGMKRWSGIVGEKPNDASHA